MFWPASIACCWQILCLWTSSLQEIRTVLRSWWCLFCLLSLQIRGLRCLWIEPGTLWRLLFAVLCCPLNTFGSGLGTDRLVLCFGVSLVLFLILMLGFGSCCSRGWSLACPCGERQRSGIGFSRLVSGWHPRLNQNLWIRVWFHRIFSCFYHNFYFIFYFDDIL